MRSWLSIIALCYLAYLPAAHAGKDSTATTQQEIKKSEAKQRDLSRQQAKVEKELQALQAQLIRAASEIQNNEKLLALAIKKLDETKIQLIEKEEQITKNKERLESLVDVALRFSRMPPEAMVMSPEGSSKTLRVSKALAMLSKDIKEETQKLARQKYDLEQLQAKLETQKKRKEAQQQTLEDKRKELENRLAKRKDLMASLRQDLQEETKRAKELAKKASSVQDLVKELGKGRELEADRSQAPSSAKRGKLRSFAKAKGDIRIPVTGTIKEGYGETNNAGSASKGITIATAEQAQVIAPYDGEVIFAGAFLNYGRMVILRHSDEFHTLLSGMIRLDVETGEFLLEGEPIGAMGTSKSQRSLYIELRKNNQPVNPESWIKGLK